MTDTPQERQEKARVRRRWLTLGELLAIAAVAISGLTLWNSYSQRTHDEAVRQASDAQSARAAAVLLLKATASADGRTLTLAPQAEGQVVQGQRLLFPAALDLAPVETTGDARIERGWFDGALVAARKAAGMKAETGGDARLPVLIETSFLAGGDPHLDRAVYLVGYAADAGFLTGTRIRLRGLSRQGAAGSEAAGQRRVDAAWRAQVPAAADG